MDREEVYDGFQVYLQLFLQPTIVAIGFFGNFAAITIILASAQLRKLASNNYLVALAACDIAFLGTLFFLWLEGLGASDIHQTSKFGCKLLTYIAHVSDVASVWLIVAVSVDRFILIYWLRLKHVLGAIRFQHRLTTAIICGAAVFSLWAFAAASVISHDTIKRANETYENGTTLEVEIVTTIMQCDSAWSAEWHVSMNAIDAVLTGFLPAIAITCLNTGIALRLKQLSAMSRGSRANGVGLDTNCNEQCLMLVELHQSKASHQPETVLNSANGEHHSTPSAVDLSCDGRDSQSRSLFAGTPPTAAEVADKQITRALIVVTTIYVSLNLPCYIVRLVGPFLHADEHSTMFFAIKCVELSSYYLYYLHHAINFYLYTFFSPQMRLALNRFARNCFDFCCACGLPGSTGDDDFDESSWGLSRLRPASAPAAI